MTCTYPKCLCPNPFWCNKPTAPRIQDITPDNAQSRLYTEAEMQAAVAAAMMRAADIARHEGDLIAKRTGDFENDEAVTARGIAELIVSAIPADAAAALEAVKAEAMAKIARVYNEAILAYMDAEIDEELAAEIAETVAHALKSDPPLIDKINAAIAGYDREGGA